MRSLWFSLVLLLAIVVARPALADETARLVYARSAGTADCPDEDALRSAVAKRLGYDPFRPAANLTVVVEVTFASSLYHGDLKLLDEHGNEVGARSIGKGSARCTELISALALSMSLAIDPLLLVAPPRQPEPPAPAPVAASPPTPSPTLESAPSPPPPPPVPSPASGDRGLHPFVGAALEGWIASAPSPTVGGSLFGGVNGDHLSLAAELRGNVPLSATEKGVAVSSFLVLGALVPCAHLSIVFGCAVASVGALTASASGILRPRSDQTAYVAIGPRAGIAIPITRHVVLRASLELGVPLTRNDFVVGGISVYSPTPVWGTFAVGGAYRF